MKYTILTIGILILLGCGNNNEKKAIPNFQEKELSFLHLRFGYDRSNNWIKKPENILLLHETFKKIGYENLISKEDWTSEWNWYLDVNKSPKSLIDSLESTYLNFEESPKYYREFWQRRIDEKNDKTVYAVVKEIKKILIKKERIDFNQEVVNDTLVNLISFEFPERELSNEESNSLIEYLIEIGLHNSAYNLVSGENGHIWNEEWNKKEDEIFKLLNKSETYKRAWFEDNTK